MELHRHLNPAPLPFARLSTLGDEHSRCAVKVNAALQGAAVSRLPTIQTAIEKSSLPLFLYEVASASSRCFRRTAVWRQPFLEDSSTKPRDHENVLQKNPEKILD